MIIHGTINAPKLLSQTLQQHIKTCSTCKADNKCSMFDNICSTLVMLNKERDR